MAVNNLSSEVQTLRLPPNGSAATTWTLAAGTTTVQSGVVDAANCQGVRFVVSLGTVTASGTGTITVQQSNDLGGSPDDYTAVQGISATWADTHSGQLIIIEVPKPLKRYLRLNIARAAANTVIDGVVADRISPRLQSPALHSTVRSVTVAASPIE